MAVNLSPYGGVGAQFLDNSGNVLTGGKIYTYAAGTTTPQVTYTNNTGSIPHSNPIILDAAGRVPGGEIWLTDGLVYKFILRDANDVLIATYDGVSGINSNFVAFTNKQEIQTATAGQTVFDLTTMSYAPGTNSLSVFVDGVNQYGPGAQYAYLETDSDTVTFVNGLHVGAEVKFTTSQLNSSVSQANAFQVSYVPPFTGSTATNVGDKLAQTVSVMDFGAVGNGVADDTTAFINAVATGSTVLIPANTTIRIATAITSVNLILPFNVVGESRDTSIIYFDVNGVGLQTTNSNARSQWSNLSIKGNLANANSAGLDLFDNSSRTLNKLNVYNFSKTAIKITQSVSPVLNDLRIYSVGTGVELSNGLTATIAPSIFNVYVSNATIQGINISGTCAHGIISNYVCETSTLGINALNSSIELADCYFEANTKDTAFADCQIIERSIVSTTSFSGSTNSYSGAIAPHRKFLFRDGNYYIATGGMYNSSIRFNSVINTWESLAFNNNFLSPYVIPNPGAISPAVIQIVTPGLYEIEYSVTWGTATATAGYGNTRVINGATEIPGSFATTYLPATSAIFSTVSRKFIAELAASDNLTFQFGASSDQIQVRADVASGPAPTNLTNATWTVRYIGATSALTL